MGHTRHAMVDTDDRAYVVLVPSCRWQGRDSAVRLLQQSRQQYP